MSNNAGALSQSTKCFLVKELRKTIECVEGKQSSFRKLVVNSKNYSENEKEAIGLDTIGQFNTFWQKLNDTKEEFDESHKRGCGLFSKSYQNSAVMVQAFMEDFSPIIDIVKDFAAPYGGLAVGTISVLFVVAGNKAQMEDSLVSAITAIKDRLPGLNSYQHIYSSSHELDVNLQKNIVLAYQGFIDFCIEASKYYSGSGLRRWLRTLGKSNSILERANKVQTVIVDIRRLCDELLDQNVHLIKQLNLEQRETIQRLGDEIKQLQRAQDDSTLSEFQRSLSLTAFSYENQRKELDRYGKDLDSDEQLNAVYFEQMRGHRLDSFKACEDYLSWANSENSCLLILSGHNNMSIRDLDQCWLSTIAMNLITDLESNPSHPIYAYYVFTSQGDLLYQPFSVILFQLIRQKREILRDKPQCDELRVELHKLEKYQHESQNSTDPDFEDKRLSAFQKVALRVIRFFDESETVYIVLDRVDRCCNLRKEVDHRKPLLKILVKLVEAARCKLRVLVVMDGRQWNVEQRRDELGEARGQGQEGRRKKRVIVHMIEQGYLS